MRLYTKFTRLASASLLFISAMVFLAAPAYADKPTNEVNTTHKSYICKYVGKPGVDERLQTGNNPIWTDNHSLTGKDNSTVKVGDTFSDAQGKSVVIVANTDKLSPEPSIDECPAAQGPTTPPAPVVPPVVGRGGEVLGDATVAPVATKQAVLANTGVNTMFTSLASLFILALSALVAKQRPSKNI